MKKILLGLIGLLFAIPVFAACPTGQIEQTYTSATGTVTQNGTPSPDNPIEPVFYQQGNMILRKINDTYADSYDATTGKITRRVGVKVLDGTEDWAYASIAKGYYLDNAGFGAVAETHDCLCSHFLGLNTDADLTPNTNTIKIGTNVASYINWDRVYTEADLTQWPNVADFKNFLASQYAAGTPVTVYYPLETPVEEDWAAEQCTPSSPIKIATTAYNSARFSPVVTELNDTIATIRSVVTNTINQTKAIADLQATKQTRPNENCPAGKKCLLVEDNDGTPHWYEIIENAYVLPAGYTELQYIESTGTQYIDTGITPNQSYKISLDAQLTEDSGGEALLGSRAGYKERTFSIIGHSEFYRVWTGGYGNQQGITSVNSDLNRHNFELGANGFFIDGNLVRTYTEETFTAPGNWVIGAVNQDGTVKLYSKAKFYRVNLWNNNTLVRDMIPAKRNSDNVIGMYDTVSGQFFTNAGSGIFTAGPEI